jgi:hypothetical protein
MSSAGIQGSWAKPLENALSIVGVHAVVLWTGKVLYFSFDERAVGLLNVDQDKFYTYFSNPNLGSYQIWDPATKTAGPVKPIGRNSFCAGQCALPDGTIFIAGGQDQRGAIDMTGALNEFANWLGSLLPVLLSDEGALKDVHTYDPGSDEWTLWGSMSDGRYYPTCLELPSGEALVAGGLSNLQRWVATGGVWCENNKYEVYSTDTLAFGADPMKFMSADQYPIIRLLPGSKVLFVHIEGTTYLFDVDSGDFIQGAQFMPPGVGRQTYPMQTGHVLLPQKEGDPPRILIVGGSTATGFDYNTHSDAPGVADGFIFEFNASSPASSTWRKTAGQMHSDRLLCDTVLLPDGKVFIVNGISIGAAAGHYNPGAIVGTAEIFDPATEIFTKVASPSSAHQRGYHAAAVLLPDARVAISGNTAAYNAGPASVDDVSIEVYSPPYLFAGVQPVVSSPIPSSLDYGSVLTIDNSGFPPIDAVMMMRPCAVTHSVDMDQRAIQLVVTPGSQAKSLNIQTPSDRSLAPPGPYMLFFLANGVPSVASFVFVGAPAPPPPQTHGSGGSQGQPDCASGGPYVPVYLGTLDSAGNSSQTVDGDVTIENIDGGFHLVLESRHGGITINHKINQHSTGILNACGDVTIGESVDQGSTATITTRGSVHIVLKVDAQSTAHITADGEIDIGQTVDQWSGATLTAGTTVHIGEKLDAHSTSIIVAQGDVTVDQGVDDHANADITSVNGSITIGQAIDNNADVTLRAPNGSITIVQKVAGNASVKWHALSFNCPDTSGGNVTEF